MSPFIRTVLLSSVFVGLLGFDLAHAQSGDSGALEEIVVTARKQTENVQDVPISISVVSSQQIRDMGLKNLDDISQIVPNLVDSGGGQSSNTFGIRGLSTTSNNPGFESGIGLYVDEVYIGQQFAFDTPMLDLARIEVLRGPQGTLFGRNTIGGAISLTTWTPGDAFEASARLSGGSYDFFEGGFRVGGALGDSDVRAGLSAQFTKRAGFLKDFATGADYNNLDSKSARLKVLFDVAPKVHVTASADYYADKNVDDMMDIRDGALASLDPYPLKKRRIGTDFDSFGRRSALGGMVRVDADLGWSELVSITALREHRVKGLLDQDFSVADISYTGRRENERQFSQELRLQSEEGGPLNYVLGFYYFAEDLDALTTANLGTAVLGTVETAYSKAKVNSDAIAGFANVEYRFTEHFFAGAGVRYTQENKTLDFDQTLSPGAFLMPLLGVAVPLPSLANKIDDGNWSGNAHVDYSPTDNVLGYVSYSRGYKAGGFNATVIGTVPSDLSFKAEFVDSYEAGLKTSWMDDKVRVNLAAFYVDYTDKQEQSLFGTTFIVGNAASATSKGFELEIFARPIEALTISAGVGYAEAKYDRYPGCNVDGFGAPVDCSGNVLQDAPKWTASLAARYVHPVADRLNAFVAGDISHRSNAYVNSTNEPIYLHEARTIVNARLGLENLESGWQFSVWGRNIFDSQAEELAFDFLGTNYARLVDPPTYGVELSVDF
jgi:iron complex outermembrane receptor protein